MKDVLISDIMADVRNTTTTEAAAEIQNIITIALHDYDVRKTENSLVAYSGREDVIQKFFIAKKVEGMSDKSLIYYRNTIFTLLKFLGKSVGEITSDDLRYYIAVRQMKDKVSNVTVDNERRVFNSFFNWLIEEDYIEKNPMRKIKKIKTKKLIKKPLSDEDLEKIRDACGNIRELALVELLISTGMRVGELELLNRDDVDFANNEIVVFGKGSKERIVYLNAKAKLRLSQYLQTRTDKGTPLFVGKQKPHKRLMHGQIEAVIRGLGRKAGVNKVHPHRFRRTAATTAINRGMPIEQVRDMLGHENIETTTLYTVVNQKNVKASHEKVLW